MPPLRLRATAAAARWVLTGLARTHRVEVVAGAPVLDAIVAGREPVIFCFWHDRIAVLAPFLRGVMNRGVPLTVFTSLSRDGELVARLAESWGADVVRGSSSRGGTDALRQLYRVLKRGGSSPVIVPDGPRGPRHQAKSGAVVLARMSGAPIVPLACGAASAWRLGSWDRLIVPRPYARVAVAVGAPETVPRDETDASLEPHRLRLEERLAQLVRSAEGAVGPA